MRTPRLRSAHAVLGIVALAAFLRLWRLDEVGFGNLYYAATVRSMLASPSNFLFGSFDPAGFVTVDKPPVGFWVQAAFAAVLGYRGIALQLPQALAGIAAVPALYAIVTRTFGTTAGLIAALVLAITPVSVAVDRNNTVDAQLTLLLLAATYALVRAAERGDLRWLLACGACVGVGFNVKMAQAYLPLPAFALTYLVAARAGLFVRALHLVGFAVVTLAASAAWIALVDLTPRDQRPFVGSSTNDTALQLAIGHNGLARLGPLGPALIPGGGPSPALGAQPVGPAPPAGPGPVAPGPAPGPAGPGPLTPGPAGPAPGGPAPGGPAPGGPAPGGPAPGGPGLGQVGPGPLGPQSEIGERGPLRLFNAQLAGQVSWTLPLALIGAVLAWALEGRRWPIAPRQRDVLLWVAWLVPTAVFLSFGGIIHRYYLVMLAPPTAALTGVALVSIGRLRGWALVAAAVVAAAATAAVALNAIAAAPPAWPTLPAVVVAASALAMLGVLTSLRSAIDGRRLAGIGCALLALPPLLWATTPLDGGAAGLPYASPELLRRPVVRIAGAPAPPPIQRLPTTAPTAPGADPLLVSYLTGQHRDERFVAATGMANTAAPLIIATGLPVMAIGGFSGSDPILDRAAFAGRVREGEVRFVIVDDRLRPDVRDLVTSRCVPVPEALWRGAAAGPPGAPGPAPGPPIRLFDCHPPGPSLI